MDNQSPVSTIDRFASPSTSISEMNISWSAILIGALASIGLSFLLNVFSMAIGLTVISTNTMGNLTIAIGSFIALLIGTIVCMFFSGWLTGYIARPFYRNTCFGGIYGFSAWCLALLITLLTASYVGEFITDSVRFLSNPSPVVSPHNFSDEAKSLNSTGAGMFIIFIMFFVGAISSTSGGYCAGKAGQITKQRP